MKSNNLKILRLYLYFIKEPIYPTSCVRKVTWGGGRAVVADTEHPWHCSCPHTPKTQGSEFSWLLSDLDHWTAMPFKTKLNFKFSSLEGVHWWPLRNQLCGIPGKMDNLTSLSTDDLKRRAPSLPSSLGQHFWQWSLTMTCYVLMRNFVFT